MFDDETISVQTETPIACLLTADERTERQDFVQGIFSQYEEARELPDGYAFSFPGDDPWPATLLQFILEERLCCPFFTFALVFAPDHGAITLHLRGSEEIKAFVKGSFLRP